MYRPFWRGEKGGELLLLSGGGGGMGGKQIVPLLYSFSFRGMMYREVCDVKHQATKQHIDF